MAVLFWQTLIGGESEAKTLKSHGLSKSKDSNEVKGFK
jgi:hypothetical protein